jgi:hypothetical protein
MKQLISGLLLVLFCYSNSASELYRVTLLRAAPGEFKELIKKVQSYKATQKDNVSIMRHSQGDHWDLMLLEPAGKNPTNMMDFRALADFQQSFLATSITNWQEIKPLADSSETFHIEMFHAVHGKAEELLQERRMENAYLKATQQKENLIFETTFGSDVDSFTIGYYKSLSEFAKSPDLPKSTFEQAAINAGFKDRSDLSFYLRKLIISHHDTLATRVD